MKIKRELFIDIRSGSVGGALVESSPKGKEIVFSLRESVPIQARFDAKRQESSVIQSLRGLLEKIKINGKARPPSIIHITLGTPWHISQTRSIVHSADIPVEYDDSLVRQLFAEEEVAFKEEHPDTGFEFIERKILAVYLNGYLVNKPLGKLAKETRLSFYLSSANTNLIKSLKKQLNEYYHQDISFHTFPLLSLVGSNEALAGKTNSYVLVDLEGEVSEVSYIKYGMGVETFSFPLGAHSIEREIARSFRTTPTEARSVYEAFLMDAVTEKVNQVISNALTDTKIKWTTYLHDILEKISAKHILPQTVVIIANKATARQFCEIMEEAEITKLFSNQSDRKIVILDTETFNHGWRITPEASSLDVFLACEIFAIDRLTYLPYN